MADYIPAGDGQFDAWQTNFVAYAVANAVALGLDPAVDIPPLTTVQAIWAGWPTSRFASGGGAIEI